MTGFVQKHENEIPGLFQDNSRTFSVFKDSISLTISQFSIVFAGKRQKWKQVALYFYHLIIFIVVLINTGTTGKLNRNTVPPRSSTNPAIFTQFSFAHHINPKEWKRMGVFYYFQGQFNIFKGNFTKFQDNSRTNGTILKFQEFSRTKVKFKDFSRSVRTLHDLGPRSRNDLDLQYSHTFIVI